jgi:hypothetical protein
VFHVDKEEQRFEEVRVDMGSLLGELRHRGKLHRGDGRVRDCALRNADLQQHLEQIRSIIEDNYWYARCIVNGGFHYDFIWEILNSKMLDEIAKGIISDWNSNLAGTGGDPDLEEDDWDDGTPSQGDDDSFYDPGIPDDIYSPIDINTSI